VRDKKYTPGPWTVDGPAQFASLYGCIVYAKHKNGHLVAKCYPEYSDNQQANARLIAAAPELVDEIERMLPYLEATFDDGPTLKLLKKVKGE